MNVEEAKVHGDPNGYSSGSDAEEEGYDAVGKLKGGRVISTRTTLFDEHLQTNPEALPVSNKANPQNTVEEERKTLVDKLKEQHRGVKLGQRLTLASNIFNQRQTLIQATSNRTDFDYLFLRRSDNTRFYRQV